MASASWANTPSNSLKCHSPPIEDEDEDTSSKISTVTRPELRQEPRVVQDCSFLNLLLEIRLKIFEYLLPHLWIDCGYSSYGTQKNQAWRVLEPSSFFELVRTSKQIYQETKLILETVPVGINWATLNVELHFSM